MSKYEVRVRADYRWDRAQIAGRTFSKSEVTTLAEHEVSDEILRAASAEYRILEVEMIPEPVQEIEVIPEPIQEIEEILEPIQEKPKRKKKGVPDG